MWLTLLLIAATAFIIELSLMWILPVFDGLFERNQSDLIDATLLALLLAPISLALVFFRHPRERASRQASGHVRRGASLTATILIVGLGSTACLTMLTRSQARSADLERFGHLTERLQKEIVRRMTFYRFGLNGFRGLWPGSKSVDRGEFAACVANRELALEFPGALGVGFIRRVEREHLDEFLAKTRADDAPQFTLNTRGDSPDLFVVEFVEPAATNATALGFDIGADPVRRAAAEQAMLTGEPTLTEPISLVQADDRGPGFLYMLPVWKKDSRTDTPENRRKALDGWVYMPLLARKLFAGVGQATGGEVDFKVYHGERCVPSGVIFGGENHMTHEFASAETRPVQEETLHCEKALGLAGQRWTLSFTSNQTFQQSSRVLVWMVGLCGTLLSFAATTLVSTLARSSARARTLADAMTLDLRESESRFREISDAVPVMVWICDSQMNCTFVNQGWLSFTGRTLEEEQGVGWAQVVHPEDRKPSLGIFATAVQQCAAFEMEYRARRHDGSYRWLMDRGVPRFADDGTLHSYIGGAIDITDRKLAEESVRLARNETETVNGELNRRVELERFQNLARRVLIETPGDGMYARVLELVRELTQSRYGFFGYISPKNGALVCPSMTMDVWPECQVPGKSCEFPRESWGGLWGRVLLERKVLTKNAPHKVPEGHVPLYRSLGAPIIFNDELVGALHVANAPVDYTERDAEQLAQLCALIAPVLKMRLQEMEQQEARRQYETELLEAKEAAELASRTKTEFLANMSHEIRTPMTAILGYAELLVEDGALDQAPPRRVEAIHTIQRNGEHLLQIINDVLDISKIEAGKFTVERRAMSPVQLVHDTLALMNVRAASKGISLSAQFDGLIPQTIQSDAVRLRQILVNLVGNAIKFTEVGSVTLRTAFDPAEGVLRFQVVDTGIGMSDEETRRLFQPFVQADSSTTRRFGGTGLGLHISRRLSELLGGTVDVSSEIGRGSVFTVALPTESLDGVALVDPQAEADKLAAAQPSSENPAFPSRSRSDRPLVGCHILLAEDGLDNQRLISHYLKTAGAEVTVVDNGQLALEQLTINAQDDGLLRDPCPFNLVLMDMQMPVMDGYTAARTLRSRGFRRPIIALTAHAMTGDRERCLEAGCNDYATKPINKNVLIHMVRHFALLGGHHDRGGPAPVGYGHMLRPENSGVGT